MHIVYENKSDIKAYGAGLLSSFGEIEYACQKRNNNSSDGDANDNLDNNNIDSQLDAINTSTTSIEDNIFNNNSIDNNSKINHQHRRPLILPWDPKVASYTSYPITEYQPTYFIAER